MRAVSFVAAVFLDAQRDPGDIDLLYDLRPEAGRPEVVSAVGAAIQAIVEDGLDVLRLKEGPLVWDMTRLSACGTWRWLSWDGWLGGLDDVGGRGLGGSRGVLACGRELLLELGYGRLQSVELRLQALASRTGGGYFFGHALVL